MMCIHDEYLHASLQQPGGDNIWLLMCPATQITYQLLQAITYMDENFVILLLKKPDNSKVHHVVGKCVCPIRVNLSRGG